MDSFEIIKTKFCRIISFDNFYRMKQKIAILIERKNLFGTYNLMKIFSLT